MKTKKPKIMSHVEIQEVVYEQVLNTGIVGFMTKVLHKHIERAYKQEMNLETILELGAGNGVHKQFVRHSYNEYYESDIRYKKNSHPTKIYLDAEDLTLFEEDKFSRVIATCLLIHLTDMENAITQWRRVVKDKGFISIYVPAEPGFMLNVAQWFTTRRKFEKLGVDYYSWQYQEHKNSYPRARVIIDKVFQHDEVKVSKFPANFLPWHFCLWSVWNIEVRKQNSN
jgi:ubiquinone/menaquinone biosynthesis C-methylase UbiE